MGGAALRNSPRPHNQRANKDMGATRSRKLNAFVKTVNRELEEIEHRIIESVILEIRKTQENR